MSKEKRVECHVLGCGREAGYTGLRLCQKHYFRQRRNGSLELLPTVPGQTRRLNAKGYVMIKEPQHPLAMANGWVYEHRKVLFSEFGNKLPDCEICGKPTNWATCHVDHRDEVIDNNNKANLRPVCRGCNTSRTQRKTAPVYACRGMKLTAAQWAKQPGVSVTAHQIRIRLKAGKSAEEAIFAANQTHPRRIGQNEVDRLEGPPVPTKLERHEIIELRQRFVAMRKSLEVG